MLPPSTPRPTVTILKRAATVFLAAVLLTGCGGGGTSSNGAGSGNNGGGASRLTGGPWEISINSTTLIEADLSSLESGETTQGSPVDWMGTTPGLGDPYDGLAPANQPETMVLVVSLQGTAVTADFCRTVCPGAWDWHLVGTVSADGNSVSGTATFNGQGQGNTFSGAAITTSPAANYSGSVDVYNASGNEIGTDTTQAAFILGNATNKYAITANLTLSGIDNGSYSLSGSQDGKELLFSGMIDGQAVSFVGYYDSIGTYTGTAGSLLVFQVSDPPVLNGGWYGVGGVLSAQ